MFKRVPCRLWVLGLLALNSCRTAATQSLKDVTAVPTHSVEPAVTSRPPLEPAESAYVDEDGNDEAFWVNQLIAQSDKVVEGLMTQTGKARRSAHAKHHACVTGTISMLPNRPAEARFGAFADDGIYPVWIRFSNAFPAIKSDLIPDGRGMAIKIIHPSKEPKLLPGHESSNTFDFPLVSAPIFPVRNVKDYYALQDDLPGFLATHPREAALVAEIAAKSLMKSPLNGTYWSMGAFKLGARAVKFKTQPCQGSWFNVPNSVNPNALRNAMIQSLMVDYKPGCFEFAVQFQKDAKTMPVEDPSVEWRESPSFFSTAKRLVTGVDPVSPFIPIARIDIPSQVFTNAAVSNLEERGDLSPQDDFCEQLSFNPWRTVEKAHPLGNLMRARRDLYAASLKKRQELNGATAVDEQLQGNVNDVKAFTDKRQ